MNVEVTDFFQNFILFFSIYLLPISVVYLLLFSSTKAKHTRNVYIKHAMDIKYICNVGVRFYALTSYIYVHMVHHLI